jgi:hypothetical protein
MAGDLSAAELERVEAHLADCTECAEELRATVALLRGLLDPEPPARLTADVMRRIEAGEGRRPRIVEFVRQASEPRFAAALAAGIAALALFTSFDFGAGSLLVSSLDPSRERLVVRSDPASATAARAMRARRPPSLYRATVARGTPARRPPRQSLVAWDGFMIPQRPIPGGSSQRFGFFGSASPEVPLRDLDGELEALMDDPAAFLDRVRRTAVEARRPMIAPLVEHSARRGDVAEVARFLGVAGQPIARPASTR